MNLDPKTIESPHHWSVPWRLCEAPRTEAEPGMVDQETRGSRGS